MDNFGIQVNDGSTTLPKFVTEQNSAGLELFDWQRRAIEYFFDNNETAIYEVTTGAGKTFCAIEIIKQIWKSDPECQVLIVVPKNIILEDTWYTELYNNGIGLQDIGVYYGGIKEYAKVTITNMQSIDRICLDIFDCVVLDEIHNFGTKRLLPYVAHDFKYKIGLSATVGRMDNMHWNILKIFNYNLFKYTPKEALTDGILNPFDFINISVEMDNNNMMIYEKLSMELNTLMKMGGGYGRIMRQGGGLKYRMLAKMNERKELVNNYVRKFDVVKLVCEKHIKDKIIIFNEFNKQTSKSYWYLLDIGVKACIFHSGLSKEKREENMIGFKNDKYNVALASKVLDEGFNLPKLDVAIIAAGNSTTRQTIQRMGRVLRKKKKTSKLYQIYVKNTIEEDYAMNRAKIFKELCTTYESYNYNGEELE